MPKLLKASTPLITPIMIAESEILKILPPNELIVNAEEKSKSITAKSE